MPIRPHRSSGSKPLGQPEAFIQARDGLFDAAGNIGEDSKKFMQQWLDAYLAWVKTHNA